MSFTNKIMGTFHQATGEALKSPSHPTTSHPWEVDDLLTHNKLTDTQVRARLENLAKLSRSDKEGERFEANKAYRKIARAYIDSDVEIDGYSKATEPIRKIIKACQKKLVSLLKGHVDTGTKNVTRKKETELKNSLRDMPDCELWLAFNGPWGKDRKNKEKKGFPDRNKALEAVRKALQYTPRLAPAPILVTNEHGKQVDSGKTAEFLSKDWILNRLPEKLHPQEAEKIEKAIQEIRQKESQDKNLDEEILEQELLGEQIARDTKVTRTVSERQKSPIATVSKPIDDDQIQIASREMRAASQSQHNPPLVTEKDGDQSRLNEVLQDVSEEVKPETVDFEIDERTETLESKKDKQEELVRTKSLENLKTEHSFGSKDPDSNEIEYSISIGERKRREIQFNYSDDDNTSEVSMSQISDTEKDTTVEVEQISTESVETHVESVTDTKDTTSIDVTYVKDTPKDTRERSGKVEQQKSPVKRSWWRRALHAFTNTSMVRGLINWIRAWG